MRVSLCWTPGIKGGGTGTSAPTEYGTGWYFGIDTGANVYQGLSGNTNKNIDGDVLSFKTNSNVGWFGGLKFGYVFGTGVFRPAIEEDWYYNGFKTDNDIDLNGTRIGGGQSTIRSGAFMTNFIGRFALGRFQPYLGASIGGYYARAVDSAIGVNVGGQTFVTNKGGNSGSLAWGAVAGADYYWTPKYSTFLGIQVPRLYGTGCGQWQSSHRSAIGWRWLADSLLR